jgi:glutathione S-transferase
MTTARPIVYHIPVCPFSQRLEILLALKGQTDAVEFRVVDITKPRDPDLLRKTQGTTSLPVLELADGRILKESLVILGYLDEVLPGGRLRRSDPYEHAVEQLLIAREGPFVGAGYIFVMNQDRDKAAALEQKLLDLYAEIDRFLMQHNPGGTFLFDRFGLAEAVYTPIFMRFWFLEYYEGFDLPRDGRFDRVLRWREACLAHPAARQVSREEIVKLYYDYALGAGNGALLPGRTRSSFVFEPDWPHRPWPPDAKYGPSASDAELGLL